MPTGVLRLFLIRHGEAIGNAEMRYLGCRDDPLTEHGRWQADCLAQAFRALPVHAIYTSPLQRTLATASAIARACERPLYLEARLREASSGIWEGLTRAEVLARSAEDAQQLHQWEQNADCAPPGGESLQEVQVRALDFIEELTCTYTDEWLVLVTHVSPIKAILCATLNIPLINGRHLFLDPATISVIDWGSRPILRLFNAHTHLGWTAARWMHTPY